ncbi:MAG TPA: hypothetical protein VHG51_15840 [Longimicrobiaceae bacterium]|nr:hypothetical protein [Longimicrobiaceae bacterium]
MHRISAALLAALALLLAAAPAHAQRDRTARLSVLVVDSAARPVAGTRVQVNGAPAAAWSDRAGLAVTRPGGRLMVLSTRGPGSLEAADCVPAVFVDGLPADMELLGALSPAEVEAVEGYSGSATAPGEYAGASVCGVILVWTRRGA